MKETKLKKLGNVTETNVNGIHADSIDVRKDIQLILNACSLMLKI
jgi:hypothetical protein